MCHNTQNRFLADKILKHPVEKMWHEDSTNPPSTELVITTCTLKDIDTWSVTAKYLVKNIDSQDYVVIVPSEYVRDFIACTPSRINIVSEEEVIHSSFKNVISKHLDTNTPQGRRVGWIYQQFLKIQAAIDCERDRIALWDADTVPIKSISFFDNELRARFFAGSEYHYPYFEIISRILGLEKAFHKSFIAQSIPFKRNWVVDMCLEIEARTHTSDWKLGILSCLTSSMGKSPFSEYETIGTYAISRLAEKDRPHPQLRPNEWLRNGYEVIGPACNLEFFHHPAFKEATFVSFERWQKPFSVYSRPQMVRQSLTPRQQVSIRTKQIISIFAHFVKRDLGSVKRSVKLLTSPILVCENEQDKVRRFLADFIVAAPLGTIVQIGANDGIMNDPLRPLLPMHKGPVILVEALPYYCDKLNRLYADQDNVQVVNALVASRKGQRQLFYIDPIVADEMDGDGPMNRWAHGQGSLCRDTVVSRIQKNQFRGERYCLNIERYIDSIESSWIEAISLSCLAKKCQIGECHLLVVNVQGAELEALSTLQDMNELPRFIVYGDDSSLDEKDRKDHQELLYGYGYVYIAGDSDRLWGLDAARVRRSDLGFG